MRPIRFPSNPAPGKEIPWLINGLRQVANNSNEDAMLVADSYSVSNYTPTRTLNAGTATLAELANFVASFIADLKARGSANG